VTSHFFQPAFPFARGAVIDDTFFIVESQAYAERLNVETYLWHRAATANGGIVNDTRIAAVNTLIGGLKTDGVWTKLDRLWLFAADSQASALVDLVARSKATAVSSPTFTVDRGFTGNGTSSYIDSNFNPTTASSPQFLQNSANMFAWSNTSGQDAGGLCGTLANTDIRIFPRYTDDVAYWSCNDAAGTGLASATGATGLYLANRTASNAETLDLNGSQIDSKSASSTAPASGDFTVLRGSGGSSLSTRQACCFGFGGSLLSGDRTSLYSRLRTYMTAVGVP